MLGLNGSRVVVVAALSLTFAACIDMDKDGHKQAAGPITGASPTPENNRIGTVANELVELDGIWTFRYDKEKAELTAAHGTETKVYRLREMGEAGELIQQALKSSGATTWTLPYTPDPVGASQYTAAVCHVAAAMAAHLGCAAVTVECAAGSTISAGSLLIPCALVVALACGAGVAGSTIVHMYCPSR